MDRSQIKMLYGMGKWLVAEKEEVDFYQQLSCYIVSIIIIKLKCVLLWLLLT